MRLTIKSKLMAYTGLMFVFLGVVVWLFYVTMEKYKGIVDVNTEINQVWINTLELRRAEKDFLLREGSNPDFFETGKSKYLDKYQKKIDQAKNTVKSVQDNELLLSYGFNQRLSDIRSYFDEYESKFLDLTKAKRELGFKDWGLVGEMRNAIYQVQDEMNDAVNLSNVLTLRKHEKDYLIRRDLKYRDKLVKLVDEMKINASGSARVDLDAYKSAFLNIVELDEEIGTDQESGLRGELRAAVHQVEPAVNEMVENLKGVVETVKSQAVNTLLTVVLIGAILSTIIAYFVIRAITLSIAVASDAIERVSQGDLNVQVKKVSDDEMGDLLDNFTKMTSKIRNIVVAVIDSSNTILNASSEMNKTTQIMSEGATEQASSAEEISSSVEEMAANIDQSSKNAKQTEEMATNGAKSISESNEAVKKTIQSMNIITDKISIIGEISRQTNLLALNAAVEAARAGEHGKGFAVVAAEIRRLAERSQVAASEIDEVSSSSVEIATKSGDLLDKVVPEIQSTAELVREITNSSIEQNNGAEQINSAVQNLNQVVQQNAAALEELSANAEELNSQADIMTDMVAFFRTGNESNGGQRYNTANRMRPDNGAGHGEAPVEGKVKSSSSGINLDLGGTNVADEEFENY